MKNLFLKWNEENQNTFAQEGITIDHIMIPDEDNDDNCVAIDYLTKNCLGRVSVYEAGDVEVEILDVDSEESLLYEHYECDSQTDFESLLGIFFSVLRDGLQN